MADPAEQPRRIDLEQLESLDVGVLENQVLQFTAEGIRVYEFVETGETELRSFLVGETEHIFSVPIREPLLQREVPTLAELSTDRPPIPGWEPAGLASHEITDPEFLSLKDSLVDEAELRSVAAAVVAERGPIDPAERIECTNCRGKKTMTHSCWCKNGGSTFTDLESGESESLREKGVPDPDCETCEGTGEATNDCPVCHGSGTAWKYPRLKLINEATGEFYEITWDIAGLLADGSLPARRDGFENVYENGDQIAESHPVIELAGYLKRKLTEIGIDPDDTRFMSGGRLSPLWYALQDESVYRDNVRWERRDGVSEVRYREGKGMTPMEIIDEVQGSVVHHFQMRNANPSEGEPNEDSLETEMVFRPLRPIEETFADLRTVVESHGGALGFGFSPIATGETGPSFFILDDHGHVRIQLSVEYDVRTALENAWLAFEMAQRELDEEDGLT